MTYAPLCGASSPSGIPWFIESADASHPRGGWGAARAVPARGPSPARGLAGFPGAAAGDVRPVASPGTHGVGLVLVGWGAADRRVELPVDEPVAAPPASGAGVPHRGGEFATAAGPATRTGPAADCAPDGDQPLTVMVELPLLW